MSEHSILELFKKDRSRISLSDTIRQIDEQLAEAHRLKEVYAEEAKTIYYFTLKEYHQVLRDIIEVIQDSTEQQHYELDKALGGLDIIQKLDAVLGAIQRLDEYFIKLTRNADLEHETLLALKIALDKT